MVDICKAAGLPEPYYEITDGFVTLVFKKKSDGGNGVNRGADGANGANCGAISLTERQTTVYELFISDSLNKAMKKSPVLLACGEPVDEK